MGGAPCGTRGSPSQNNMSTSSKPKTSSPVFSSGRVLSQPTSEHAMTNSSAASNVSLSPPPVESSILSETLSNIDFDDMSESVTASDTASVPMVPWNMHAETKNGRGNTLVTQTYNLVKNTPHLSHTEWRTGRGRLRGRDSGLEGKQNKPTKIKSRPPRKSSLKQAQEPAGITISRDFFLIVALCIGLACALICLTRPFVVSMLTEALSFPG
ncbi:hypothetical protein AX17_003466 [Amanita inopinata Kibby_2008]|nr:hypothetical protein AX17_003466 [Amanita inopinata Kibby_2008]